MRPGICLISILAACSGERGEVHVAKIEAVVDHVEAIRAAARGYRAWGKVDERPEMAPEDCMMPVAAPDVIRMSTAEEGGHGRKLYYLWASARKDYLAHAVRGGFTIIKEAYAAVPARPGERSPTIELAGHELAAGEPHGLYVMTKVLGNDTDQGWIYGTITPDGTVTSAGRVASCMRCHIHASHDRLFGLKR